MAQGQGGTEFQPADILKYFEELKRDPNKEIGTKDIFEMASSISDAASGDRMKERNEKREMNESEENVCPRCRGTGMVCGQEPEILPGACCADFANVICPECGGTGKDPRKRGENGDG